MTDLCYATAAELLTLFGEKKVSPVEVLKAQLERIGEHDTTVNAITDMYVDEALSAAEAAEQSYFAGNAKALEGITVAVKDEQNIAGKRTPNGSLLFKNHIATYTDPICERLLEARAIVHARTAAPEFSANYTTWSNLNGVTRNPWNLDYSVGGSSGGSGAALASGFTTLATGSEIGGSIRSPAAQNGVVGYKPPHGRVPKQPPGNLIHYYTDGPMARSVADIILMENVIAGPHRLDIASLPSVEKLPLSYGDVRGIKLAYSIDMGGKAVDPDVRRNTLEIVSTFRKLGAIVDEIEIGWNAEEANNAAVAYLAFMLGGLIESKIRGVDGFDDLATTYVKMFREAGKSITRDQFIDALNYEAFMFECIQNVFDRYDALLCPTVSIASVAADFDYSKDELIVDGKKEAPVFGPYMTHYFNMLSRCPVLSVPSGFDRNGVPTGVQIVGPAFDEKVVFQLGTAVESSTGGYFSGKKLPSFQRATEDNLVA